MGASAASQGNNNNNNSGSANNGGGSAAVAKPTTSLGSLVSTQGQASTPSTGPGPIAKPVSSLAKRQTLSLAVSSVASIGIPSTKLTGHDGAAEPLSPGVNTSNTSHSLSGSSPSPFGAPSPGGAPGSLPSLTGTVVATSRIVPPPGLLPLASYPFPGPSSAVTVGSAGSGASTSHGLDAGPDIFNFNPHPQAGGALSSHASVPSVFASPSDDLVGGGLVIPHFATAGSRFGSHIGSGSSVDSGVDIGGGELDGGDALFPGMTLFPSGGM